MRKVGRERRLKERLSLLVGSEQRPAVAHLRPEQGSPRDSGDGLELPEKPQRLVDASTAVGRRVDEVGEHPPPDVGVIGDVGRIEDPPQMVVCVGEVTLDERRAPTRELHEREHRVGANRQEHLLGLRRALRRGRRVSAVGGDERERKRGGRGPERLTCLPSQPFRFLRCRRRELVVREHDSRPRLRDECLHEQAEPALSSEAVSGGGEEPDREIVRPNRRRGAAEEERNHRLAHGRRRIGRDTLDRRRTAAHRVGQRKRCNQGGIVVRNGKALSGGDDQVARLLIRIPPPAAQGHEQESLQRAGRVAGPAQLLGDLDERRSRGRAGPTALLEDLEQERQLRALLLIQLEQLRLSKEPDAEVAVPPLELDLACAEEQVPPPAHVAGELRCAG